MNDLPPWATRGSRILRVISGGLLQPIADRTVRRQIDCVGPDERCSIGYSGKHDCCPTLTCKRISGSEYEGFCKCMRPYPTKCGDVCVDLKSNRQHCGVCGNACAAGRTCRRGTCCVPYGGSCVRPNGLDPDQCCDADGGVTCRALEAGSSVGGDILGFPVQSGACGCSDGRAHCGGRCVNLASDEKNCGRCRRRCRWAIAWAIPPIRKQTCCGGRCTDTGLDPNNCGRCGALCHGPFRRCSGGKCVSLGPIG